MTQEEKQLLLKDLCARLPYGVICKCLHSNTVKATAIDTEDLSVYYFDCDEWESIEHCKPYLRPMSSMTKEEKKEYKHLVAFSGSPEGAANFVDWLNKKMFAYRTINGKDMFELSFALEAPKDMYNLK